MAELIASSTSAANSADFTVAAGTPVTVFLKSAASIPKDAEAIIEIKSAGATYHILPQQLTAATPALVIDGPGTYRIGKRAAGTAFGVDQG